MGLPFGCRQSQHEANLRRAQLTAAISQGLSAKIGFYFYFRGFLAICRSFTLADLHDLVSRMLWFVAGEAQPQNGLLVVVRTDFGGGWLQPSASKEIRTSKIIHETPFEITFLGGSTQLLYEHSPTPSIVVDISLMVFPFFTLHSPTTTPRPNTFSTLPLT